MVGGDLAGGIDLEGFVEILLRVGEFAGVAVLDRLFGPGGEEEWLADRGNEERRGEVHVELVFAGARVLVGAGEIVVISGELGVSCFEKEGSVEIDAIPRVVGMQYSRNEILRSERGLE